MNCLSELGRIGWDRKKTGKFLATRRPQQSCDFRRLAQEGVMNASAERCCRDTAGCDLFPKWTRTFFQEY